MAKGNIFIGTSGWHYKHWKGAFYPEKVKETEQLDYYRTMFNTVEINNSFYRLPTAKTFDDWRKATPRKFVFAVKASRYITHMKKLKGKGSGFSKFFNRAEKLKGKLGPILFQLPPKWNVNTERLSEFLSTLPKGHRYAFEFRNHTWYDDDVYQLLKKHKCAFCIYELGHHLSPFEVTADFVYVRLHGPGNRYQGSYTDTALKKWARQCREWQKKKDVYVYFDNDQAGFAAFNALRLLQFTNIKAKKKR